MTDTPGPEAKRTVGERSAFWQELPRDRWSASTIGGQASRTTLVAAGPLGSRSVASVSGKTWTGGCRACDPRNGERSTGVWAPDRAIGDRAASPGSMTWWRVTPVTHAVDRKWRPHAQLTGGPPRPSGRAPVSG